MDGNRNDQLDPESRAFYLDVLGRLEEAGLPFLVGGAYAFGVYTGIERHTKDIDLFVRAADKERVLDLLAAAGYDTETTSPHWLAKAHKGEDFVDVIFSSGNAVAKVDDRWFDHAVDGELMGRTVKLCPPEEMIWSKSFVMERERFDGADVAHLIRACGQEMDWQRLLQRFDDHWPVLFAHLVLFCFVYPCHRGDVPRWVLERMVNRLQREVEEGPEENLICRGTLLSRAQYLVDIERWGYQDARLLAPANMDEEQIEQWTDAIDGQERTGAGA